MSRVRITALCLAIWPGLWLLHGCVQGKQTPDYALSPEPKPSPAKIRPAQYRALSEAAEANLRGEVLEQWFPRAVNTASGGFNQNYTANWTRKAGDERFIVYQARLTWTAARAALHYPQERQQWVAYARHGVDFMAKSLWDAKYGGFFWELGADGKPRLNGEKRLYGNAFAIYGLSAYYRATRDARALTLAQKTFLWCERHGHDGRNGGYFETFSREGKTLGGAAGQDNQDTMSVYREYKSMNAHVHMLEALAELARVWPDPLVKKRLREVFLIVRDKIVVTPPGVLNSHFTPDWRPLPELDSYGHDIEAAYLLLDAAEVLDLQNDAKTWSVARQLVDHTLQVAWDPTYGGFFEDGEPFRRAHGTDKLWWIQAEALQALLLMHARYGQQTPRYWNAFLGTWRFINERQIDHGRHGWFPKLNRAGEAPPNRPKSDRWTDCYHQARSMMNVAEELRALEKSYSDSPKS